MPGSAGSGAGAVPGGPPEGMKPAAIRVLYVDDEPGMLEIGRLFLEKTGEFEVTTLMDATEAIRLLSGKSFDVIISDYQMPVMDGLQFLVEVRTRFGRIPFILFTGRGREEVVIRAINSGADFYLQKGGDPRSQFAELVHKIHQAHSRKKAEDALRKSEEDYQHLIERSDEAIAIVQDGIVRRVNPSVVALTGYTEQELISRPFSGFIHPDDRAMVEERHRKRLRGEEAPSQYSFRLTGRDGSTIWVEISTVSISWDGLPATINFLADISGRIRAEEALIRQKEYLDRILNTIADPVFVKDELHKRVLANDAYCRFTGFTREEMLNKSDHDLYPRELADHLSGEDDQVFASGAERVTEEEIVDHRGEVHTIVTKKTLLEDRTGKRFIVGIARDMTESKHTADALHLANKKLSMLNSITRHDILNQLAALRTHLDLVKSGVEDPVLQGYLLKEERAAKAIHWQIEFTRNYQDIGGQEPKWQQVQDTIGSAFSQLKPPGIDFHPPADPVEIFADPLLEKVFYNLIENSLRHGEHVTRVNFAMRETESGLVLTYTDNGVGIPAEDKARLFQKGFGKHTGLGLFLSLEILSITGISITETGEPGCGVRFEITVPKGSYRPAGSAR